MLKCRTQASFIFRYTFLVNQITGWWPGLQPDQGEGEKRGRELNLFWHIPCMTETFCLGVICRPDKDAMKLLLAFEAIAGNSGSLVICIKLEVHIIDELPITLPESQVMALNLIIIKWSYGSKRNDSIPLEGFNKLSNALSKGIRISTKVLIIDINSIQIILLDNIYGLKNEKGEEKLRELHYSLYACVAGPE
ncbi:unnamed protein product, partial [Vitis vinifera]